MDEGEFSTVSRHANLCLTSVRSARGKAECAANEPDGFDPKLSCRTSFYNPSQIIRYRLFWEVNPLVSVQGEDLTGYCEGIQSVR